MSSDTGASSDGPGPAFGPAVASGRRKAANAPRATDAASVPGSAVGASLAARAVRGTRSRINWASDEGKTHTRYHLAVMLPFVVLEGGKFLPKSVNTCCSSLTSIGLEITEIEVRNRTRRLRIDGSKYLIDNPGVFDFAADTGFGPVPRSEWEPEMLCTDPHYLSWSLDRLAAAVFGPDLCAPELYQDYARVAHRRTRDEGQPAPRRGRPPKHSRRRSSDSESQSSDGASGSGDSGEDEDEDEDEDDDRGRGAARGRRAAPATARTVFDAQDKRPRAPAAQRPPTVALPLTGGASLAQKIAEATAAAQLASAASGTAGGDSGLGSGDGDGYADADGGGDGGDGGDGDEDDEGSGDGTGGEASSSDDNAEGAGAGAAARGGESKGARLTRKVHAMLHNEELARIKRQNLIRELWKGMGLPDVGRGRPAVAETQERIARVAELAAKPEFAQLVQEKLKSGRRALARARAQTGGKPPRLQAPPASATTVTAPATARAPPLGWPGTVTASQLQLPPVPAPALLLQSRVQAQAPVVKSEHGSAPAAAAVAPPRGAAQPAASSGSSFAAIAAAAAAARASLDANGIGSDDAYAYDDAGSPDNAIIGASAPAAQKLRPVAGGKPPGAGGVVVAPPLNSPNAAAAASAAAAAVWRIQAALTDRATQFITQAASAGLSEAAAAEMGDAYAELVAAELAAAAEEVEGVVHDCAMAAAAHATIARAEELGRSAWGPVAAAAAPAGAIAAARASAGVANALAAVRRASASANGADTDETEEKLQDLVAAVAAAVAGAHSRSAPPLPAAPTGRLSRDEREVLSGSVADRVVVSLLNSPFCLSVAEAVAARLGHYGGGFMPPPHAHAHPHHMAPPQIGPPQMRGYPDPRMGGGPYWGVPLGGVDSPPPLPPQPPQQPRQRGRPRALPADHAAPRLPHRQAQDAAMLLVPRCYDAHYGPAPVMSSHPVPLITPADAPTPEKERRPRGRPPKRAAPTPNESPARRQGGLARPQRTPRVARELRYQHSYNSSSSSGSSNSSSGGSGSDSQDASDAYMYGKRQSYGGLRRAPGHRDVPQRVVSSTGSEH